MKIFTVLSLVAVFSAFASASAAMILLSDNFSGPSLDTSKWKTLLPYAQSSIIQSGGELTTTGRGILATVNGYTAPYTINGVFTMHDDLEHFNIALRTNLSVFGNFNEMAGVIVTFVNDGNGISIQEYPNAPDNRHNVIQIASTGENGYDLITGDTYFFSIFDDGSSISLAVNGVSLLSAATTFATGDQIALYSREFSQTSTSIDAINIVGESGGIIVHTPETGMTFVYLMMGMVGILATRRQEVRA